MSEKSYTYCCGANCYFYYRYDYYYHSSKSMRSCYANYPSYSYKYDDFEDNYLHYGNIYTYCTTSKCDYSRLYP